MKTIREAKVGATDLRLLEHRGAFSGVVIIKGAIKNRVDGDDADAVWQRLLDESAKSSPSFFGYDGAVIRFRKFFPDDFPSPVYLREERNYKVAAKERLDASVPVERALTDSGLGEDILAIYRNTNLLSPFEKVRMQDVLRGPRADEFIRGAAQFALGDIQKGAAEMLPVLAEHDVGKWTAITYLPFLWRPNQHMFLKPEITKAFSERVGHTFHNDYTAKIEIPTYESLLDLTQKTREKIVPLKPQDNIDVQSFIWVVGDYTDADLPVA